MTNDFTTKVQNLAESIQFDASCLITEIMGQDACRLPGLHDNSDISDIESVLYALQYIKDDIEDIENLLKDRIEELSE